LHDPSTLADRTPHREHAIENFDYLRQPGAKARQRREKAREPAFIAQAKKLKKPATMPWRVSSEGL
jgi:hypothetical protein